MFEHKKYRGDSTILFEFSYNSLFFWSGLVVLGITVGFLMGMFGVGGGFLLTPFLKIFFNVPYEIAVGSSIAVIFLNSIFAIIQHRKRRNVDFHLGMVMGLGALMGAEVGIRTLQYLSFHAGTVSVNGQPIRIVNLTLNLLFFILMFGIGLSIFFETFHADQKVKNQTGNRWAQYITLPPYVNFKQSGIEHMSVWFPLITSFAVGIVTGLLGVGGGFVNLPLLIYCIGTPTLIAVGTSTFQILIASGYGTGRYFFDNLVNIYIVLFLFSGSLAGLKFGIYGASRLRSTTLRRFFSYLVLIGSAIVGWDIFREFLN